MIPPRTALGLQMNIGVQFLHSDGSFTAKVNEGYG